MLVEPSRPRLPGRAGPLLNAAPQRVRIRRRTAAAHEEKSDVPRPPSTSARAAPAHAPADASSVRLVLLVAALVMAASSRGDVTVLATLLAFGSARRSSALAAATALGAAMVRWGSGSLRAIAGAQAVLGPAGWTGGTVAVTSSWLAALALVAAARPVGGARSVRALVSLSAFAVAAADVVAGPSAGGALGVRVLASIVALALAFGCSRWRAASAGAAGIGVVALAVAGFAR